MNCERCYDTGYVGGFEEVKQMRVDLGTYSTPKMIFSQIGRVLRYEGWAKVELSAPNIYSTQVPPFSTQDLLVRKDNDRFIVRDTYYAHKANQIHRVDATLDFVPYTSIWYKVVV